MAITRSPRAITPLYIRLPGRSSPYTPCHVVTNATPARRAASNADHAGARDRACTSPTPSRRITRPSRPAFSRMFTGSLVISDIVTCRPPARSTCVTIRPPALATRATPPVRATASAISTVPRSTPPVSNDGNTCSTRIGSSRIAAS